MFGRMKMNIKCNQRLIHHATRCCQRSQHVPQQQQQIQSSPGSAGNNSSKSNFRLPFKMVLPISVGIGYIALQHYYHVRQREIDSIRHTDIVTDPESLLVGDWTVRMLKTLPFRTLSRLWGHVTTQYELPVFMRGPLYRWWTWQFNCNLEEMDADRLEDYPTLNAFFTRRLKPGCRVVAADAPIVCPADSRVLHFGPVSEKTVEQVKGVTYRLDSFIGTGEHSIDPTDRFAHHIPYDPVNNQLYHCVLYLAPGDYHRFHSPADWAVVKLKHFSGQLFSVSPGMVKVLRGLFTLNERIVMLGEWKHGFFSMTAVGATNVGSIQLAFDDSLQTNRWIRDPHGSYTEKCLLTNTLKHPPERLARLPHPVADGIVGPMHDIAVYDLIPINARSDKLVAAASNNPSAVTSADQQQQQQQLNDGERGKEFVKGDELGQFNLGSTVVLVFEAPRTGHEFYVRPNEKVQYGQPLFGKAKRI